MQPKGRRCVSHETGKRHLQSHTRSPPPSQQYPPGKHPQPVGTHPAPEQRCARRVRYAGRALPAGTQLCCQSCSETIMHLLLSQNGKKKNPKQKNNHKTRPNLTFSKGSAQAIVFSFQWHHLFNKSSVVGVIPRRYPAVSQHRCSDGGMLREAGSGSLSYSNATVHNYSDTGSKQVLYRG